MSISRIRPSLVAVKLEILAGEDVEIDEAEVPYEHVRILGYGYCSFVDEVKDVTSGRNFARKTFRVERGRLDTAQQMLRHEVRTIRELAPHPHIIRVHATYIAGRNLAIILQPVADGGNLAEFLCAYRDMDKRHADKWRHNVSIRRSFGCLARCVDYLHSAVDGQKPIIRHKDIKPGNILIHRGYPILTDFGISTRCSADQTTTTGRPDQFTRKYCAPEVAEFEDRNRKSDIFSLGCVFLEMFAILYSDGTSTPSRLRDLYDAPLPYHERLGGICTTLLDYPRQMDTNALILTIVDMLHKSPSERLSSKQVVRAIEPNVVPCEKCEGTSPS